MSLHAADHASRHLLERSVEVGGTPRSDASPDDVEDQEPERLILCAACRATLTRHGAAIEKDGAHEHTFVNPALNVFKIRCFARAPGVLGAGEPSDYWSWFEGYTWRAALCRQCLTHVGWCFTKPDERFFGLIAEQLLDGCE